MKPLDEEELNKLLHLCRIEWTEEEKNAVRGHLSRILDYFQQLNAIDTTGVKTCYHVSDGLSNVMREDVVGHCLPREEFLSNAPAHTGGMIRVPPVIKSNS